ncbi:MAG: DUF349 domain-containing protein [Balneolia bacterium]|nr:DUF349 domain-containing protein [Balneolia bacterium]
MQTEASSSNDNLFENDFCHVTAEGALIQNDNTLFSGKTLEEVVTAENAEDRAAHFSAAFSKMEAELKEKLSSIEAGISADELDKHKNAFLSTLKEAEAVGDFPALMAHIENDLKAKAVAIKNEAKPAEAPEDTQLAEDSAQAVEEVEANKETKPADTQKASETDETEAKSEEEPEELSPEEYYKNLTQKAQELSEIRNTKTASSTYDELKAKWAAGPDFDHIDYYKLKDKFEAVEKDLETRRLEYQKQQEEKRKKNLAFREELLDRVQKIIDDKKWAAQGEISNLTRKFESVKPLPNEGPAEQDARLQSLLSVFEENRVEYLVQVRQQEEDNLTGKLFVIEKIESLISGAGEKTADWKALDDELEKLFKDWKKIGRIPKEKEDDLWKRFHAAREQFFEARVDYDPEFKKEMDKNIDKRLKLIARAEELKESDSLATAARDINNLHNEWKKLGPIPQAQNDELWARFKKASDEFNSIRDENADKIKEEESKNLAEKERLIEEVQKLIDSEGWKGSTKKMEKIFEEWKAVGPVPRRKSNTSWKKFRKLMDNFYKERRSYFKEVRSEQQDNLKTKRDIVDKITELSKAENIEEALTEVKALQEQYKQIGFVPIKHKDKIWDKYREANDLFFGELRQRGDKSSQSSGGGRSSGGGSEEKQLSGELFKLRKEADQIRNDIAKYADTKTYFKPNKKGQKLIDEIQGNIDKAESKLEDKEKRIAEVQQQLEELKNAEQD